ncbi:hypothetical protein [Herbaspirillum sp. SJZ107]|uniref:hypothetical protein n=1 Tax=Herbaspirillum sp. SJZ107 TaxID=2572881 RepID=UPI0011530DC1|nr:hypothetical protein [Herbaspirillum sp. SJZ107]
MAAFRGEWMGCIVVHRSDPLSAKTLSMGREGAIEKIDDKTGNNSFFIRTVRIHNVFHAAARQ